MNIPMPSCPDGGICHHVESFCDQEDKCFRVNYCVPFQFYGEWCQSDRDRHMICYDPDRSQQVTLSSHEGDLIQAALSSYARESTVRANRRTDSALHNEASEAALLARKIRQECRVV